MCYILVLKASNNEAEYEDLSAGLRLAKEMKDSNLEIYSHSQLIVYQVMQIYQTKEEKMMAYFERAKELLQSFTSSIIKVIPRAKNSHAHALVKLTSTKDAELLNLISEFLLEPSINRHQDMMEVDHEPSWMDPIINYLTKCKLSEDKIDAKILRINLAHYVMYDEKLYRQGYSMPLL